MTKSDEKADLALSDLTLFEDLQKFFAPENQIIRTLLTSKLFTRTHFAQVKQACANHGISFSQRFFQHLESANKAYIGAGSQTIKVLKHLHNQLDSCLQTPKCTIITANELTQEQKLQITNHITSKHGRLRFEYEIRPKILGGLCFKIGSTFYDGSFSKILLNMKVNMHKEIRSIATK